jgi:molybdopterin synthase catalytic subunit
MNKIIIQHKDFDLTTEIQLIKQNDSNIGAVVSFVGTVRDLIDEPMIKMTLEHYPKMTEKALEKISEQAQSRWNVGNITIIHRVGDLSVNEQIVLVMTSSKHRKDAFASCEFIMDYLKTQAPFWKKEHTKNDSKWVEANQNDLKQSNRW